MKHQKLWIAAVGFSAAFLLWTAAVCLVDIQAIGPLGSSVGLATLNGWFHGLTGVHMALYTLTDWLSLIPIGMAMGFAILGLAQWIKRKSLRKVDADILSLGGFYIFVGGLFVLFELWVVNHRPVLIEGVLEASYPSSTTLLTGCILPTTIRQCRRIRRQTLRRCLVAVLVAFTAFMIAARLVSGVHWLTDIIGGGLLSAGLVTLYAAVYRSVRR